MVTLNKEHLSIKTICFDPVLLQLSFNKGHFCIMGGFYGPRVSSIMQVPLYNNSSLQHHSCEGQNCLVNV